MKDQLQRALPPDKEETKQKIKDYETELFIPDRSRNISTDA